MEDFTTLLNAIAYILFSLATLIKAIKKRY